MPSISPGRYRQPVSVATRGSSIVVFSDVDGVLRAPHMPAFTTAAAVLRQLAADDAALVLCSGKTRAELEFVQQKLDITHPFICENGGAVIIPSGYFDVEVPNARAVAGRQAVEFGRPYAEVVDVLHRTADRLRIEIVGFSDMSIEEVARDCRLPLLDARLAKLREYDEPFRLIDPGLVARARLFKALDAAKLRGREGRPFDRAGAPVDCAVGVNLLIGLYRRSRGDLTTIAVTHTSPGDNLLRLVDYAIVAADDNPGEESINVIDWAEAIVDRVKRLREGRTASVPMLKIRQSR
jgi:mannosyl-3-phosphoglycerate phosphatase